MSQSFMAGDNLIFQLESGYGLLRVLAVEGEGAETTWHLLCYEELFPDPENAEEALANPVLLHIREPHLALTNRAFERTPAAKLTHHAITEDELALYRQWQAGDERPVADRSVTQLLGMR